MTIRIGGSLVRRCHAAGVFLLAIAAVACDSTDPGVRVTGQLTGAYYATRTYGIDLPMRLEGYTAIEYARLCLFDSGEHVYYEHYLRYNSQAPIEAILPGTYTQPAATQLEFQETVPGLVGKADMVGDTLTFHTGHFRFVKSTALGAADCGLR